MKKIFIFILLLMSGISGLLFSLKMHHIKLTSHQVETIQTFHYPTLFVDQIKNDPHAGQKIFKEFCSACHDKEAIIDVPAPRIDDKKAWKIRKKWGINHLLNITIRGVGAMPARGGCFECSDDELRKAIEYIIKITK